MVAIRSHRGWAIATGEAGFIGRYWHFGEKPAETPYLVKLFATRKEARAAMKYVKPIGKYHAFPKARVVGVEVTVRGVSR